MSNLIKTNTALIGAETSIQVANKLLAVSDCLPDLIPYRKGDKWGFCDLNKKIVIQCIYDDIKLCANGFFIVMLRKGNIEHRNYCGLMDNFGCEIFGCHYQTIFVLSSECICLIRYGGAFELCNGINKTLIDTWPNGYNKFNVNEWRLYLHNNSETEIESLPFSEGLFALKGCYADYINNYGEIVIKNFIPHCTISYNFSEGLAVIQYNMKWGYINKSREIKIPLIYDTAYNFTEGLAMVCRNNKYGFINTMGEEVIPLKYGFDDSSSSYFRENPKSIFGFSDGLAGVQLNGCGYIDKNGKEVIGFKYTECHNFSEGLAKVGDKNGLVINQNSYNFGYINKNGNEIIKNNIISQ
jgi:hypothetical protein